MNEHRLDVLNINEVAALFKVHPSTIYRLLKRAHFPAFKVGRDWRFLRESIDDWVNEQQALMAKQRSGEGYHGSTH